MTIGTNMILVFATGHDQGQPKEWPKEQQQDDHHNDGKDTDFFLSPRRPRRLTIHARVIRR